MSYLEAAQKNYSPNSLTQLEAKIAKIENFMKTIQVILQHIIDKGIAQKRKEKIMAAIEKEKIEKEKKKDIASTYTKTKIIPALINAGQNYQNLVPG